MNDTYEAETQAPNARARRWLLLLPQLPPKPDYLRVKLRRRLRKLGAVAVRGSVYVLPARDECLEDFRWLRREIVGDGGDAVVVGAAWVDGLDDAGVEALFRADRDGRYAELTAEAEPLADGAGGGGGAYARLRRRLDEVVAMDWFDAPGRGAAERAVRRLDARSAGGDVAMGSTGPRGRTWVTRRGVKVDRISSAWLIRRFIDPDARFRFVPAEGYTPAEQELRFDMFAGEFTHDGDRCTFEVLLSRFGLEDAGLRALGEIVHDLDCKDGKFGRAETAGVSALMEGIVAGTEVDAERLERGAVALDGLYAGLRRQG